MRGYFLHVRNVMGKSGTVASTIMLCAFLHPPTLRVVQSNDCLASEAYSDNDVPTASPLADESMTNKGMQLEDQVGWLILFDQIPQGLADS